MAARLTTDVVPNVKPFADVDVFKRILSKYGLQYNQPLQNGLATAELAVDPATQVKILNALYRQRLGKDSELTASGAYIQPPSGRPDYNVQLQYRKTFAAGGPVNYDPDEISAMAAQLREELHA